MDPYEWRQGERQALLQVVEGLVERLEVQVMVEGLVEKLEGQVHTEKLTLSHTSPHLTHACRAPRRTACGGCACASSRPA